MQSVRLKFDVTAAFLLMSGFPLSLHASHVPCFYFRPMMMMLTFKTISQLQLTMNNL